ncbi:hypothetical protein HDU83_009422 [Entophlyctis luteolus]|nr:hypothetical protein HDU83_009422 [Entophlyctis luteolus]KAJ3385534.1 hypothetical protein HDU84_002184 [Entophlyctis sp. JEL0112]
MSTSSVPRPYAHLPHYQPPQGQPFPLLNTAAWATGGLVLNAWARSMARLPLVAGPVSYVLYSTGMAAVGYSLHAFEQSLYTRQEMQKDKIVIRRMALLESTSDEDHSEH